MPIAYVEKGWRAIAAYSAAPDLLELRLTGSAHAFQERLLPCVQLDGLDTCECSHSYYICIPMGGLTLRACLNDDMPIVCCVGAIWSAGETCRLVLQSMTRDTAQRSHHDCRERARLGVSSRVTSSQRTVQGLPACPSPDTISAHSFTRASVRPDTRFRTAASRRMSAAEAGTTSRLA